MKVTGVVAAGLLVGGGAVLAQSGTAKTSRIADDQGGLVVAPLEVDRAATAGATNSVTVENRSKEALSIEVKARPWRVSGAGDATVWAVDSLAVTLSGVGNVSYWGDPQVEQTITGVGVINWLGAR